MTDLYVWGNGTSTPDPITNAKLNQSQDHFTERIDDLEEAIDAAATSVIVQEQDGSPSVAATTIKVPNGALTNNGAGTVSVATLVPANNLSDVGSAATSRTNLGLGDSATRNVGTTAGTVAAGDDSRLTDSRTPSAHANSHISGGSDPFLSTQLIEAIVRRIREGGNTDLLFGAIADGEYLKRVGDTVQGASTTAGLSTHDHTGPSDGGILTNDVHDGYIEITESTPPGNPASTKIRMYAQQLNGITRIRVKDAAGRVFTFNREFVLIVRNTTGSTISKGKAVYVSGQSSGTPLIGLAKADSPNTLPALGVTFEDIANNAYGYVVVQGYLTDANTASLTAGASMYVSAASGGDLTSTKPAHPNLVQRMGTCTTSNSTTGVLQMRTSSVDNDETGTRENTFYLGDATNGDKYLYFAIGSSGLRGFKWNNSTTKLQYTNDGSTWADVGSATIATVTGLQAALDLKAPLASPTFTGTVSGITKAMVGLGNVDNTSDASKPVSTATQTALDLKAPLASPALTGNPTAPTQTAGNNSTRIATTAYVDSAVTSGGGTGTLANQTTLTDASTIATDASAAMQFNVSSATDRTLGIPTNASSTGALMRVWRWKNTDASSRTLTLTTSGAGAFRYGSDFTSLPSVPTTKTIYVFAVYHTADSRWDVVSYSVGH